MPRLRWPTPQVLADSTRNEKMWPGIVELLETEGGQTFARSRTMNESISARKPGVKERVLRKRKNS